MPDARGFELELERFIDRTVPKAGADMQRRLMGELLTGIVMRTPVGNHTRWKNNLSRIAKGLPPLPRGYVGGQARRNWQVTIDVAPSRTIIDQRDASGLQALSEGAAVISRISERPADAWIANPLDYMEPLENGWSRQAPEGMVAKAVADVVSRYARVLS